MIDRKIVKFKTRRGTDAQRKLIVPEQGEFYLSTDTNKVYIGDGSTVGGVSVSSKTYAVPSLTTVSSVLQVPSFASQNDIIFNKETGITYIVDLDVSTLVLRKIGSDGSDIDFGPVISGVIASLSSLSAGITLNNLNQNIVDPSGSILLGVSGLKLNFDTNTLAINGNKLTVIGGASGGSITNINTNTGGMKYFGSPGYGVNADNHSIIIKNNALEVVDYDSIVSKVDTVYNEVFGGNSDDDGGQPIPDGDTTPDVPPTVTSTDIDKHPAKYIKPYIVKQLPIRKSASAVGLVVMQDNTMLSWGGGVWGEGGTGYRTYDSNYYRSLFYNNYLLDRPTVTISKVIQTFVNSYVLLSDGTLWATGYNYFGNVGLSAIPQDTFYVGGTDSRGTSHIYRRIEFPLEDTTEASIKSFDVAGDSRQYADYGVHGLAISTNGKVYGWGSNSYGELGVASDTGKTYVMTPKYTGIDNAKKVYCARSLCSPYGASSYILTTNGTVFASGYNGNGNLGLGNTNNISNFQEVPISQSGTPWAKFRSPAGMVKASNGKFYIADRFNQTIRTIDLSGNVTTFAGSSGKAGLTLDNVNGSSARFYAPHDITQDKNGNFYVADRLNHRIRKIDASNNITIYAGLSTSASGIGSAYTSPSNIKIPRLKAKFNEPTCIVYDSNNHVLYVADTLNQCIRSIDLTTEIVDTIAGRQGVAGKIDGVFGTNTFYYPHGLALTNDGKLLYVADTINGTIRKIDLTSSTKTVTTAGLSAVVAGSYIHGIALSQDENFAYVAVYQKHVIYRVCIRATGNFKEGDKTLIAGVLGKTGLSNGNATDQVNGKILFNYPMRLIRDGNILYVTEGAWGSSVGNNSIRKIILNADGTLNTISTFAGNVSYGGNDGICSLNVQADQNDPLVDIHGNPGSVQNIYIRSQKGYVYTSGKNQYGQLGRGNTTDSSTFVKVQYNSSDLTGVLDLAVSGESTVMAVVGTNLSNKLYTWGYNGVGAVGNDTLTNQTLPYVVSYITKNIRKLVPCVTYYAGLVAHGIILDDGSFWVCGSTGSDTPVGNNITQTLKKFTQIYVPSKNVIYGSIITAYGGSSGGNATGVFLLTDDGKLYQSGGPASTYFTGPTNQILKQFREVRF